MGTSDQRYGWAETAVKIGCSIRTLQRLKAEGRIGYVTVGVSARPKVFFTEHDIETYLRKAHREPKKRNAG